MSHGNIFFSTLVIGGAGSFMLELYGWESVFYASGVLSVLWAYCMWKYLLKGEGKCSNMLKSCSLNARLTNTSLDMCTIQISIACIVFLLLYIATQLKPSDHLSW